MPGMCTFTPLICEVNAVGFPPGRDSLSAHTEREKKETKMSDHKKVEDAEVTIQAPSTSFELALAPKTWTREETESRIIAAMVASAVTAKGQKPKDWYGSVLECRNIILGEKKKMPTQDAGNIDIRKTAWNVRERDGRDWFWIDSYTLACEDFAVHMLEALGDGPWPIYLPIVFGGQITKVSKGGDDLKDIVTLA